jgi:two-component system OmpR family response regulator
MRREHDDESGNARHDGAGQRHGRRGNAGRIAAGLLTGELASPRFARNGRSVGRRRPEPRNSKLQFIKCYLVVRLVHQAYFLKQAATALAPQAVARCRRADGARRGLLPPKGGRRCPALFGETHGKLQVVDMTVVSGKRTVVEAGTSSAAGVFAAAGNRLMTKVLLIEDDSETAEEITAELADRGFEVEWSADGIDGLDKARSSRPDAMIVDRLLPGMDGLTVIEALRKDQVRTPVLVLSALGAVDDRVRGLRMGGDDYLTKPFALVELVARVEALLRRPLESRETTLRVGPLELDLIERTAKRGDRAIDLLPREFRLLEYMMQRSDQLLTRAMLLEEVWNYKFVPATNLVDVHMGRLRHKVDGPDETPMIHNVRGAGFILRTGP